MYDLQVLNSQSQIRNPQFLEDARKRAQRTREAIRRIQARMLALRTARKEVMKFR